MTRLPRKSLTLAINAVTIVVILLNMKIIVKMTVIIQNPMTTYARRPIIRVCAETHISIVKDYSNIKRSVV